MADTLRNQLFGLTQDVIGYLPNLFAGVALVLIGWFLGWAAKRVTLRVAVLFRLERVLTRFRWGQDFSKGDVRYSFYGLLGNIVFLIIFLIFLDNAFVAWKLRVFSDLLERGIYFFPRIILSLVVFSIGWLIATWASRTAIKALNREKVPRASLIGSLFKAILILLFSAMALVELDIGRQVVMIGFVTIFVTSGIVIVVLAAVGGKTFIQKIKKSLEEK
jgi:Mechanosensitive ion channel, conserved TM helix